ncbi:MAG: ABC transporter substrate-binding protein [Thermodesulfobacteriota bacterium]|nr:ABC transporter substrate-binding protein [Thermodesulfobacteriota bacterium]
MNCYKRVYLFLFVVSFLLVISGYSPGDAWAKKPKAILIPCIIDLSGPYAAITAPAFSGFSDAAEYVNQKGGIKGVPLKPVIRDCGGRVNVAISHYMEFREMKPKPLTLFISVSAQGEALRERIVEDKFMAMSVPGGSSIYPIANTFGLYPLYQDMFGGFIDWVVENWDYDKMGRKPKISILTWDTTFGRAILTPEVFEYAKKKNIDLIDKVLFSIRDLDVTTQLIRIKMRKPDWVYTNVAVEGSAAIVKSAQSIKYNIKLGGNTTLDWSSIMLAGELLNGTTLIYTFKSWDDVDDPGIKILTKWFTEKKRKPTERTLVYQLAWANVLTLQKVISEAVDEVGWDKLDGNEVKRQMEKLQDFAPMGLTYYSFNPKKHAPGKAYIAEIKDEKIIPISDWRELPDLRPAAHK